MISISYSSTLCEFVVVFNFFYYILGSINNALNTKHAPPISALVILKGKNEPGGGFWGCSENVPIRPKDDIQRMTVWMNIIKVIEKFDWTNIVM